MKHTLLAATFLAASHLALVPATARAQTPASPGANAPSAAAGASSDASSAADASAPAAASKPAHHRRHHRHAATQAQGAAGTPAAAVQGDSAPANAADKGPAPATASAIAAAAVSARPEPAPVTAAPSPVATAAKPAAAESKPAATASSDLPQGAGPGLTPTGAIQAGNADGTIPAWTGGYHTTPSNRPVHTRPDPFPQERPLFSITAQNVDRYASKLAAGTITMIRTLPGFRVDVYPTHRTFAAPQYIYDNAVANVTRARSVHGGEGVEGAQLSIPFPIPHDGHQAIWNHILRWRGSEIVRTTTSIISTAGGFETQRIHEDIMLPYNIPGFNNPQRLDSMAREEMLEPARDAGALTLAISHQNPFDQPRLAYTYTPGERRVRRAPEIDYDTPFNDSDGLQTIDDFDMFNGALDRYEWTLVGRREVYVPYNTYRLQDPSLKYADLAGRDSIKPDYVRWELHRVWVVEAKLRPEFRHIYTRRTLYLDEDSWQCVISDRYDARGALWRSALAFPIEMPEVPVLVADGYEFLDFFQHRYYAKGLHNQEAVAPIHNATGLKPSDYTADALRRVGRR